MKEIITKFAEEYETRLNQQSNLGEDLRKVHHPVVFLFIGDEAKAALEGTYLQNQRLCSNHQGIMYLHIYNKETYEAPNVFGIGLDLEIDKQDKGFRKQIREHCLSSDPTITSLNEVLRKLNGTITETGRYFASTQELGVTIVTMAHDPLNILLADISLLLKGIFRSSFNRIKMDLYTLLTEKADTIQHHLSTASAVSFFREVEFYQQKTFTYREKLEVAEGNHRFDVEHGPEKLLNLVYILSDRLKDGFAETQNMEDNYEIICRMNLLKNRTSFSAKREINQYDDERYAESIQTEYALTPYSSVGFSKVVRPNKTIAITVMYHLYKMILDRLRNFHSIKNERALEMAKLDISSISQRVSRLIPPLPDLEERWLGVMMNEVSYEQIKDESIKRAEQRLHEEVFPDLFTHLFTSPAKKNLEMTDTKKEVDQQIQDSILTNQKLGLFYAQQVTQEGEQGFIREIRDRISETERQLELANSELVDAYNQKVETGNFKRSNLPFIKKKNIEHFSRYVLDQFYFRTRQEILRLELTLQYLRNLEIHLLEFHDQTQNYIKELEQFESLLLQLSDISIELEAEYLSKNIFPYYEKVVHEIIADLERKKGENFFFDDRYIGKLLTFSSEEFISFIKRIFAFCNEEIFPDARFYKTIEEELLDRSNLDIKASHQEVLKKSELFKELSKRLEDYAEFHINLFEMGYSNAYVEKYFFGDTEGEFIRWADEFDKKYRTYDLRYIHEEQSSGIEKLNLIGGFHISDLRYYENHRSNYDFYLSEGFVLHSFDLDLLPELEPVFK
ncbi:hypothetical protein [Mesobacillus jeotgali]|uniref:hypothetical protein n=1 Tax=Mesobacillus jeotgali TaxID=129985 RepID=UPI001CFE650B|nr:hypothetical protein [Mesobacillus jeotgali]